MIFTRSKYKQSNNKGVSFDMIRTIEYKTTKPQFLVLIVGYIVERMLTIEKWCYENNLDAPYILCVDSFILPLSTFEKYCDEFKQKFTNVKLG